MRLRHVVMLALPFAAGFAQSPGTAPAVPALSLPAPVSGWNPPQKQTLTYAVDWRVFQAGTATVHLESDGSTERVTVSGDSQGAINLLFRVSDRFQSSFNRTTGCSESFSRQTMEGRRQVNSSDRIDGTHRTASYEEQNLISRINIHQTFAVSPCVTDVLSGIFFLGSQTLDPAGVLHLPVVSGNHVTNVTVRGEARETVRTPAATYHAVRVQPTADTGAIRNRGKLWIWYSDDARHLPVQMRARLFWGTLTFRLTSIENK